MAVGVGVALPFSCVTESLIVFSDLEEALDLDIKGECPASEESDGGSSVEVDEEEAEGLEDVEEMSAVREGIGSGREGFGPCVVLRSGSGVNSWEGVEGAEGTYGEVSVVRTRFLRFGSVCRRSNTNKC